MSNIYKSYADRFQDDFKSEINEVYVVKYYGGDFEDRYEKTIFATTDKKYAERYVIKFNTKLQKWKQYHNTNYNGSSYKHIDRWYELINIYDCYYEKIELRK